MNTYSSEPAVQSSDTYVSRKERREARRGEAKNSLAREAMRRKLRRVLLWAVVIVVIGLAGWGMWSLAQRSVPVGPTGSAGTLAVSVSEGEHVKGNPDAPITVVEYSDFQCPACASFAPVVMELLETSGDQVRVVYRQFPLKRIHPNAEPAARAAEAAALQGAFWEMHDKLFEGQQEWSGQTSKGAMGTFERYAEELGLDGERFKADVDSDIVKDAVEEDIASGTQSRVNATPSFFVNGQLISGFRSLDEFTTAVLSAPVATSPSIIPSPNENQ